MKKEFTDYEALEAAKVFFPKAKNPKRITKGYLHFIFEVDSGTEKGPIILRFSNGNKGVYSLAKEIRVNKILAENNLPVAEVLYYHKSNKNFSDEFAILSKIPGEDVSDLLEKVSFQDKIELVKAMGELLGEIHTIKLDTFGFLTEEGIDNKYLKFDMKKQGNHVEPINHHIADYFARAFNDIGLLAAFDSADQKFIEKIIHYLLERKPLLDTKEKPTLTHGDFEPRNIRAQKINGKWEITGVLDFEYTGALMKEFDFIKLQRYGYLDKGEIRKAFLKGYTKHQTIPKDFDEKVSLFRTIRDVGFASYLLKAGNKELAEKTLKDVETRVK